MASSYSQKKDLVSQLHSGDDPKDGDKWLRDEMHAG
jgi:hypothetical protein